MHHGDVFEMLPTSVREGISAFTSFRRSDRLSITSSRCRLAGRDTEKLVVTSRHEESQFVPVKKKAAEAEMGAATRYTEPPALASGIRWRYAEQGTDLQHKACAEHKRDPVFSRKSYVDGLSYSLMALPDSLSDQEIATIRDALPLSTADTTLLGGRHGTAPGWSPPRRSRTVLQRFVASCVASTVVLLRLLLACAAVAVSVGADYEREHNISQRVASWAFIVAKAVGRHSVVIGTKICAIKEGRVGKAVSSLASQAFESVACGIQEGIGQGMMMLDLEPKKI
ncbi:hypothetical protein F4777DRAFT_330971 [Nemania sp. FL0916]|nr:hypothetical protein F4777DRAFT_330971 [Nemania sp. FL0916]